MTQDNGSLLNNGDLMNLVTKAAALEFPSKLGIGRPPPQEMRRLQEEEWKKALRQIIKNIRATENDLLCAFYRRCDYPNLCRILTTALMQSRHRTEQQIQWIKYGPPEKDSKQP